ncbi:hypothetical protein AB0B89_22125, partial [Sphaerisporangium sp. NPDC049002]
PRAAQLFDRAAATATTHGLSAARDALVSGRDLLPTGFTTRERLVRTIQWWSASDVPTAEPARPSGFFGTGGESGEVVTLLYAGGAAAAGIAGAGYEGATPAGTAPSTRSTGPTAASAGSTGPEAAASGPTGPTEAARSGEMRFGPGVPTGTTAAQIWRSGREQVTVPANERPRRAPARRRRGGALWSGAVFALVIAAALFLWFQRGEPLSVTAVEVKTPKAKGCDIMVNVIGVITTNGAAGQVSYEWLPSGEQPVKHTDSVPSGQSAHQVSLKWDVGGRGTKKLTARLRVLSPVASGARLEDKASFTYKC